MPDLIRIRSSSAQKHWSEERRTILAHRLASGPDPFGQNLRQSARTKSDPGWFSQYDPSCLWKNTTEYERGNWWQAGCILPEFGPDDSCTLACIRTRCIGSDTDPAIQTQIRASFAQSDPCLLWKKWNQIRRRKSDQAYTIQSDSGCRLALTAITGHNRNAFKSDQHAYWRGCNS